MNQNNKVCVYSNCCLCVLIVDILHNLTSELVETGFVSMNTEYNTLPLSYIIVLLIIIIMHTPVKLSKLYSYIPGLHFILSD